MATTSTDLSSLPRTTKLPLSLKGVSATPPLTRDLNLDDLTSIELSQLGLTFAAKHPQARAMVQRLMQADKAQWIVPELVVRKGLTHVRRPVKTKLDAVDFPNSNWSGGVILGPAAAPLPATGLQLDGYATEFNSQQHINFIRNDGHVCELVFVDGWSLNDLTQLSGAPVAETNSAIDGYATNFNQQQHVNFIGLDNHVHELFFDGSWKHNDLTDSAGGVPAMPGRGLTGYATEFNEQQHVIFIGPNQHIFELFFDGQWRQNDLTFQAGASNFPAAFGSALHGYVTNFNQQQHINFIGFDNHVHELFFNGSWQHNDLTQAALAPAVAPGSSLAGYATEFNEQQHVIFTGADNAVHELFFTGSWQHNNLTERTGAPAAQTNASLDGYVTNFNRQQHVNFIAADNLVHELFFDGDNWNHNNLASQAGAAASLVKAGSTMAGYATEFNGQQHVIYIDGSGHVDELFFIDQWKQSDLSQTTAIGSLANSWVMNMGRWTVPAVSQPDLPDGPGGGWVSSSWVGIDGHSTASQNSNDVLQAGVEQQFDGGASYTAWYEWFAPQRDDSPDYIFQTNIDNLPVTAGDQMACVVSYINSQTRGSIFLANETTGHMFSIELDPPPGASFLGNSIEWIMETPGFDGDLASLPAFTDVVFTDASGLDVNNALGNPQNGDTETIVRNDVALTASLLQDRRVVIEYLPWHPLNLTGETGAPTAAPASNLDGYVTNFNEQQHINFIGSDNHVYELVFEDGWKQNDLTVTAKAPDAISGSALDGYATEFNQQQHVNYIGADLHVHELVFDGEWKHNDLTVAASAPAVIGGSSLDGYATEFNQQQHVNYIGADLHVHELVFDGAWKHNDLTKSASAPNADPATALDGYSTNFNEQQHVNFLDSAGQVHELFFDGAWKHNNLTVAAGAPNALPGSPLDGYATAFNQQQHVNFIGPERHVHELFFDGAWKHNDLTNASGAANFPVQAGSRLDGYATEFNEQQHVNFLDINGHVQELLFSNNWSHNDLTRDGTLQPKPGSPLAGYASHLNQQQHVIFITATGQVIELMF